MTTVQIVGIVVAVKYPGAPGAPKTRPASRPQTQATALRNNSPSARYPTPSAPPMEESAAASANSRYTKNYEGSATRVTFANSPQKTTGSGRGARTPVRV